MKKTIIVIGHTSIIITKIMKAKTSVVIVENKQEEIKLTNIPLPVPVPVPVPVPNDSIRFDNIPKKIHPKHQRKKYHK